MIIFLAWKSESAIKKADLELEGDTLNSTVLSNLKGKHSFGIWMYWGRKAGLTNGIILFPSVPYFLSCYSHFSPFPSLLSWFLPVASLQSSLSLRAGICVLQTLAQLHSHLCSYRCNQQPSEQRYRHQQAHHSCLPASGTPRQTPHFLGRKMTGKAKYHRREWISIFLSIFLCTHWSDFWNFFFVTMFISAAQQHFAHASQLMENIGDPCKCWSHFTIFRQENGTFKSSKIMWAVE